MLASLYPAMVRCWIEGGNDASNAKAFRKVTPLRCIMARLGASKCPSCTLSRDGTTSSTTSCGQRSVRRGRSPSRLMRGRGSEEPAQTTSVCRRFQRGRWGMMSFMILATRVFSSE